MPTSLAASRTDLTEAVLDFLVDQWRRLNGSAGGSSPAAFIIDPEVLVALTSSLGRYDSRVFDAMVDWLGINGRWINVQRLFRLIHEDGYADSAALGAVAASLVAQDRSGKWRRLATSLLPPAPGQRVATFHRAAGRAPPAGQIDDVFAAYGLERAPLVRRGQAGPVRMRQPGSIFCTSRAVFGVSARADVMAYLVVNRSSHARGLGASLGYNHMQVRAVLQAIEQAGIAVSRPAGRTLQYSIDAEVWSPVLVGPTAAVEWVAWRRLARGLHALVTTLWGVAADRADPSLAAYLVGDAIRAARGEILQGHPWLAHPGGRARLLGEPLARRLAALDGP
jgi:hypothetical protein